MTLNEYLTYNGNENIGEMFIDLYRDLEIINKNDLVIMNMDMDHIYLDEDSNSFAFDDEFKMGDEKAINDNLMDLTKIFFGSYVESPTGYKDFSKASTDWVIDAFDELKDTIPNPDFEKDYFRRVFDGEIVYFNRYKEKEKDKEVEPSKTKKMIKDNKSAFILKQLLPAIALSIGALLLVIVSLVN